MYQMLVGKAHYNRYLAPGAAPAPWKPATALRRSGSRAFAGLSACICMLLVTLTVLSTLLGASPAPARHAGPAPTPPEMVLRGPVAVPAPTAGPQQGPPARPVVTPAPARRGPVPTLAPTPERAPGSAIVIEEKN